MVMFAGIPSGSKRFVRTFAGLTWLFSLVILGWLFKAGYAAQARKDWRLLGVVGLFALIPILSARAAMRSWRFRSDGVTSISAVWGLAGLLAFFYFLLSLLHQFSIHYLFGALLSLVAVSIGYLLGQAEKRLKEPHQRERSNEP